MNEMLERVAKALADCALEPFDELSRSKYMGDARAAIEAMREPTEEMTDIIENCDYIQSGLDDCNKHDIPYHSWHLMIEAALG